ncbi:hypothetical protein SARC_04928 [Sphaeroforma arctica JP610]|uniref:Uncharacterized protein n=1 Tax=Sphaeroforma arctica JP610 TaxID=667725 RepID=A0A0L0G135_9EUKA|nr:hypothetical protein SARC_04928 [Sphaeroforma arctica JP610]KNC82795.1 hypothetical protein SARC_04928 [Sphaeroforma arctica JP610]|eukprot:XP_014156697.1 hypothetical protein SARC_04928 [Sphaeroforma arctica JP610]
MVINRTNVLRKVLPTSVLLYCIYEIACHQQAFTNNVEITVLQDFISPRREILSLTRPTEYFEPRYIYSDDLPAASITQLDLTCPNEQNNSQITFSDVLDNINELDDNAAKVICKLVIHDNELGDVYRNVIVSQHGGATRAAKLKSFTLKFVEGEERWRDLEMLVLKKDSSDKSGLRSKILFDAFKEVPSFNSLRTNFMELSVSIERTDGSVKNLDYGIYINFEPVNEGFVNRRNWRGHGKFNLYKLVHWDIEYDPRLLPNTDPEYNDTLFREVMDYEGNDGHNMLVEMMLAINKATDDELPDVLREWFDMDNLCTWVAITFAICGDWDHRGNNMALFTNDKLRKFYFQPWDYDKSLRTSVRHSRMDISMSPLNNHYLFRRILVSMPIEFMALVWDKVQLLTADGAPFSHESLKAKADEYALATAKYSDPNAVDARYVSRVKWQEHEDDFFGLLHNNPPHWNFNNEVPTSVSMNNGGKLRITDDSDIYTIKLKPALSPRGLEVEHQIVLHRDFDPVVTHWYHAPENIIYKSKFVNLGRVVGSIKARFSIGDEILSRCFNKMYSGCWVNIHSRDSEGRLGNYAARPMYLGAHKLHSSREDAINANVNDNTRDEGL